MEIQAPPSKVPTYASDVSRRVLDAVVLVLDLIAVALSAIVVHGLRDIVNGDDETVPLSAISSARAIIAKSVFSFIAMVAVFFNRAGNRKETIIVLILVTLFGIVLIGMASYSIHEADQLVALNSAGAVDLTIFKASAAIQIITAVVEVVSYVVALFKTPRL